MIAAARNVACTALLGLWLGCAVWAAVLDPTLYAVGTVILGALVASLAVSEASPAAIGAGAVSALLYAAVAPHSFALAGAVGFAAVFSPRALRARTPFGTGGLLALAAVGGGAGAHVAWAYAQATEPVQLAAIVVGTLLVAMPLFWPIDDPVAFALRSLAGRTGGTLRTRLLRGVAIRRRAVTVHGALSRPAARRVRRAWTALVRAARARVHGSHSGADVLDRRIRTYLDALCRATRAAARAHELTRDLDDVVIRELELERDDLVARADALVELH